MTWIAGITTLLVAFALTAISGKFLIPFLRKLKFGQTIKEIGPTWHEKKNGTPTMGGIMFAFGSTVALIVGMFILTVNHTAVSYTHLYPFILALR